MVKLIVQVSHDIPIEQSLRRLPGESFDKHSATRENKARLDFKVKELWKSRFTIMFHDDKDLFTLHAKSYPKDIADTNLTSPSQRANMNDE